MMLLLESDVPMMLSQEPDAKFVTNLYPRKGHYEEYSISRILSNLNWDSLEDRRNHLRLTMAYKILNDHVIIPPESLPRNCQNRSSRQCTRTNVGNKNKLIEKYARLDTTRKTFFFDIPKMQNERVSPSQIVIHNQSHQAQMLLRLILNEAKPVRALLSYFYCNFNPTIPGAPNPRVKIGLRQSLPSVS